MIRTDGQAAGSPREVGGPSAREFPGGWIKMINRNALLAALGNVDDKWRGDAEERSEKDAKTARSRESFMRKCIIG
jgi:hypothetical protein